MVCSTVLANQTTSIETEDYRQVLQSHIVNDVVVGALHKCRVDVAEWTLTCCSKTCREGYGVSLGNTHVETTLGHLLHHYIHRATRRHCRCNTHYSFIQLSKVEECLTKYVLHTRTLRLVLDALTSIGVEASWSVPYREVILCWCIAISLFGDDMEELRRVNALQGNQRTHQSFDVVSINTTEVAETETLEEVTIL